MDTIIIFIIFVVVFLLMYMNKKAVMGNNEAEREKEADRKKEAEKSIFMNLTDSTCTEKSTLLECFKQNYSDFDDKIISMCMNRKLKSALYITDKNEIKSISYANMKERHRGKTVFLSPKPKEK